MRSITARFVISNIISSIILIGSIPLLKQQQNEVFNGVGKIGGIIIFLVLITGQFASVYKAKVIATIHYLPRFNRLEKIFLGIIFFFGVTSVIMTMVTFTNVFGSSLDDVPSVIKIIAIILTLTGVVLLVVEALIVFGNISVKPKKESKWVNLMVYLYVSVGIAIGWDTMVLGSKIGLSWDQSNIVSELIASVFLALMLFFPFQRLFWFEIMAVSRGWKDNLVVFCSVLMVLICAIIPLFYK